MAQQVQSAADVTGVGRGMDRPLDIFLSSSRSGVSEERTLFILIDSSEELGRSSFLSSLDSALNKNQTDLSATRIGIAKAGAKLMVILEPSLEHGMLLPAARAILNTPNDSILNLYSNLRGLSKKLAGSPGSREILLVTLANGDAEDDLSATTRRLVKSGIKLSVIASEAYLSDCYWAKRSYQQAPKDCKLHGAESAYIELPWAWLFQREPINEITPSGYAYYGLSRLAAATEGRVHIYTPASKAEHACAVYNRCLLCDGDHVSPTELYKNAALEVLAPLVLSREEVGRRLARDPYYRATNRLWQAASRVGLLSGTAPLKLRRTAAQEQASRGTFFLGLTGLAFSSQAKTADRAIKETDKLIKSFEAEIGRIEAGDGSGRQQAIAALCRIMLRLTRINLISYAEYCRDLGPRLADPKSPEPIAPEVPSSHQGRRATGIYQDGIPLCHGVSPLLGLEVPGREKIRPHLEELAPLVREFETEYRNTPFAVALHRAGLAKFRLSYAGTSGNLARRRPGSKASENGPSTGSPRPRRRAGGSGTGSSGPSTGRKR